VGSAVAGDSPAEDSAAEAEARFEIQS